MSASALCLVLAASLVGCAAGAGAPPLPAPPIESAHPAIAEPAPSPISPAPQAVAPTPPVDAPSPDLPPSHLLVASGAPGACQIELTTRVEANPEGGWQVIATIRNRTSTPLPISLPIPCNGGAAEFTGIPDYDFYGVCTAMYCRNRMNFMPAEQGDRDSLLIRPDQVIEVGRGRVSLRGDQHCTKPLPPRVYPISFTVDLQGATTCAATTAKLPLGVRTR